jgi:hypothetical protein
MCSGGVRAGFEWKFERVCVLLIFVIHYVFWGKKRNWARKRKGKAGKGRGDKG